MAREGLDAHVQAGLIAGGGVLLDHAGFGRAVDYRKCGGQQLGSGVAIFRGEGAAHGADLVTQTGAGAAIDDGAALFLTDALQS